MDQRIDRRIERRIEFWFDFASPYSYLTAARIGALARQAGVAVAWRPFLLGPIFADRGWTDSPFVLFPDKGRHMWRDVEREAVCYGVPVRRPTVFPVRSVLAARVALVADEAGFGEAFCVAAFAAQFVRDEDIASAAVIDALVAAVGGGAGAEVRARAGSPESKAKLRAEVERARGLGIFGAPSFVTADGELFWGNDRLERALAWPAA